MLLQIFHHGEYQIPTGQKNQYGSADIHIFYMHQQGFDQFEADLYKRKKIIKS